MKRVVTLVLMAGLCLAGLPAGACNEHQIYVSPAAPDQVVAMLADPIAEADKVALLYPGACLDAAYPEETLHPGYVHVSLDGRDGRP